MAKARGRPTNKVRVVVEIFRRVEKRGPDYCKFGKRVMYRGTDLNAFVEAHRVEPQAA